MVENLRTRAQRGAHPLPGPWPEPGAAATAPGPRGAAHSSFRRTVPLRTREGGEDRTATAWSASADLGNRRSASRRGGGAPVAFRTQEERAGLAARRQVFAEVARGLWVQGRSPLVIREATRAGPRAHPTHSSPDSSVPPLQYQRAAKGSQTETYASASVWYQPGPQGV